MTPQEHNLSENSPLREDMLTARAFALLRSGRSLDEIAMDLVVPLSLVEALVGSPLAEALGPSK